MSGHSKWSTIKHKKGATDAKRGKIFTKLIREITVSAKTGGGDVKANPRLRAAVQNARGNNMPMDTINRAITKATSAGEGADFEEVYYEGYGPSNIAVVVLALTDNRNRTIASVRTAFNKNGGNMAAANAVAYMFDKKGTILIEKSQIDEDTLLEAILEAGAEDLETEGADFLVICPIESFESVKAEMEKREIEMKETELSLLPQNKIMLTDKEKAEKAINFVDILEDNDDVQKVFVNFDIDDDVLAQLS